MGWLSDGVVLPVKRTLLHIYCVIISTESETQQISQTVVTAGRPRHHHSVTSQNSWCVANFTTQGYAPNGLEKIGLCFYYSGAAEVTQAWCENTQNIPWGYKSFPPAVKMVVSFIDKCVCSLELASPKVVLTFHQLLWDFATILDYILHRWVVIIRCYNDL